MSWRAARGGVLLILSLVACALRFVCWRIAAALRGKAITSHQRAQWMHLSGRVVLRAIGMRYQVEGTPPSAAALIVSNHLSYLDIAVFSAAVPCLFVAKSEVGSWPGFGSLARLGGTIFVDRQSRYSAWRVNSEMAARFAEGVPVLVFPEGTSTDGSEVQRFHSSLFHPAAMCGLSVVPAAVFYRPFEEKFAEKELCWFGEESFLPHLMRVLELSDALAVVRFGAAEMQPDRKTAAWRSHDAIASMRDGGE